MERAILPSKLWRKQLVLPLCACQGFVTTSQWPHVNPKSLKRQAITSGHSGHLGVRQLKDDQDDFSQSHHQPDECGEQSSKKNSKALHSPGSLSELQFRPR